MSEDIHPGSMEFERLEQELYALIEMEQATLLSLACTSCWIREVAGACRIFKRRGGSERDAAKARAFPPHQRPDHGAMSTLKRSFLAVEIYSGYNFCGNEETRNPTGRKRR